MNLHFMCEKIKTTFFAMWLFWMLFCFLSIFTAALKKILPISTLLLALFFVAQSGYGWLLHLQKEYVRLEVRHKMMEGFAADELILIEIPFELETEPNALFRRIHSKEFEYLGQMYDIVSYEKFEDVTWYLVFPDIKESKIKQRIKQRMRDIAQNKGVLPIEKFLQSQSIARGLISFFESNFFDFGFLKVAKTIYCFVVIEYSSQVPTEPPCFG